MTAVQYSYNGKFWRPCATVSDENSFFHATFGNTCDKREAYLDKQARFRRMRWSTFLTYFENQPMPDPLTELLVKCLSANDKYKQSTIKGKQHFRNLLKFFSSNDKYKHRSVKDKHHFESYVSDIMAGKCVIKEEIPILSALENVKIVLLSNEEPDPVVTVNPKAEILGNYPNVPGKYKTVVLCMQGNKFLKLEPFDETGASKCITGIENKTAKKHVQQSSSCLLKYEKGGSAGSKGVEFQVTLLTILLLNSLRKLQNWKLSTENKKAGKFDDAVLEWSEGAFLIQAKHKEKEKRITLEELLSTNSKRDDFSLSKYFLSYQEIKGEFKGNNTVIICTNASIHEKALAFLDSHGICSESMLYCADKEYAFNTFNLNILPRLKQSVEKYLKENYKNKNIDETVNSDENLKDFLGRLQFYYNYPVGNDTGEVTQKFFSFCKCSGIVHGAISFSEVYAKVMKWFQLKKGIYLTEIIANAMLFEIRSDQYWQNLGEYNVSFKENLFDLQKKKRFHYVNTEGGFLLQELKIYQTLKNTKSKILYANFKDGIELQKKVIEAFQVPFYTILIISWPENIKEFVMGEMYVKLRQIIEQKEKEIIILLAKNNENLLQQIGADSSACNVVNGSVLFEDFAPVSQTMLLNKNVVFQGTDVSLHELLGTQINTNELGPKILEKLVRGEQIRVGQAIVPLQEQIDGYYIDRTFKREIKRRRDEKGIGKTEIISEEKICDVKDKVVLIADAAGMGKSTVLSHLAFIMKNKYPHRWVIQIELNNYTTILQEFKEKNRFIDIIELLDSNYRTKLRNQLEKVLFSVDRKVVILIDGVDEISPDYTELVVILLAQCQKGSNFAKVIVTTRPNMTQELASKLQLEPFMLLPFTESNQICFLTNYWIHHIKLDDIHKKCEEYADLLIKTTSSWTTVYQQGENHFAAIPLLVRMLAEVFQSNDGSVESNWEGCNEFLLKRSGMMPTLPEKSNMTKIYKMFIEKKQIIFRKKGNPSGNTTANKALDDQFEECLAYHRMLALDEILRKSECELFQSYQQENRNVEAKILKMGIVQQSENSFYFTHRTFAEYFVAESLMGELQLQIENKNQNFQKFFFDEILLKAKFKVVRAFLDNFLKEIVDSLPSNIFDSYRSLSYMIDLKASYHLMHSQAEEGCTAVLQLLFKCIDFKIVTEKEVNYYNFFRQHNSKYISSNTLVVLDSLARKGGVNICDEVADTPLIYATRRGHLEMMTFLVKQGANLNLNFVNSSTPPLWIAIIRNRFDMVQFMIQNGAELTARLDNKSMLYTAISTDCRGVTELLLNNTLNRYRWEEIGSVIPYASAYLGRLNLLEYLVEKGMNVNSTVENEESLIFGAARGGQLDIIKYLVEQGADINAKDAKGNTMLHLIVTRPSLMPTVKLLIELGIKMNVKNSDGTPELHLAMDMVELLVENGADVNERNNQGSTFLHIAVRSGTLETVEYLIAHGSDINMRDNSGATILHSAALYGKLDIVQYIVTTLGADVNITDDSGCTPLHVAVSSGDLDTTKFLVEHGAHINTISVSDGETPLHRAAMFGRRDTIAYFEEAGVNINILDNNSRTALHIAAFQGKLDAVKCLVELGVNINLTDSKNCTALHLAAFYGKREIVKFLSKHHMDNNRENEDEMALPIKNITYKYVSGKTTLHFAAEQGDLDTIKFLAELGVDLNITDDNDKTALHYAAMGGQLNAAKLLVELGSDVNIKSKGLAALHWAAWRGHRDVVDFFLQLGICVDVRTDSGCTALHYAAAEGHLDVIKCLVKHNGNVNAVGSEGRTPLHLAVFKIPFTEDRIRLPNNILSIVKILIKQGADVNIRDFNGDTAAVLAERNRSYQLLPYLKQDKNSSSIGFQ